MYFEYNDFIYGLTLCKVSILKGILILLFYKGNDIKYVPKNQIKFY